MTFVVMPHSTPSTSRTRPRRRCGSGPSVTHSANNLPAKVQRRIVANLIAKLAEVTAEAGQAGNH